MAWQSASQQVAVVAAALIGFAINKLMAPATLSEWGWRIPFWIGSMIVPFLFVIRRSLQETAEFQRRTHRPTLGEMVRTLAAEWAVVVGGMAMVVMTTVTFYLITVYTPSFGRNVLKLAETDSLLVTTAVGLSNFIWLPIAGALSDRVGRKPILVTFCVLSLLSTYPLLSWLVREPSFGKMLAVELWLSVIFGWYNGAITVALTEVVPTAVRTTGFSLAYSLATTLGGSSLAISTWLIHATGDKSAPAYWMGFAAMCGLLATLWLYRRKGAPAATRTPARA